MLSHIVILNTSIVRNAIANKDIIEFTYQGYLRIAEPHIYGIHNGKRQLLVYQIGGGSSSGRIPDWRRMDLNGISGFKLTGEKFAGSRPNPTGEQATFDTVIAAI